MALVRIDNSFINPDFVKAILPSDGGRAARIIMADGLEITTPQYPGDVAALFDPPPPPPFDDDFPI